MAVGKPTFTQKTYGAKLYEWSPSSNEKARPNVKQRPYFCSAIAGSQGQDWVTTYSFNIAVTVNGQQEHLAYVACDYVQ